MLHTLYYRHYYELIPSITLLKSKKGELHREIWTLTDTSTTWWRRWWVTTIWCWTSTSPIRTGTATTLFWRSMSPPMDSTTTLWSMLARSLTCARCTTATTLTSWTLCKVTHPFCLFSLRMTQLWNSASSVYSFFRMVPSNEAPSDSDITIGNDGCVK